MLDRFVGSRHSLAQMIHYEIMLFPELLNQVLAPSSMIATLVSLGALARNSELTAMLAAGFGTNALIQILIVFGALLCVVSYFLQDRILPPLYRHRTITWQRDFKNRPNFTLDIEGGKIWYRSKHYIYNLESFDQRTNSIQKIAVYAFGDGFQMTQVLLAEDAKYEKGQWMLAKGVMTQFSAEDGFPISVPFTNRILPIQESPDDFREIEKEANILPTWELFRYAQRTKSTGGDSANYEVLFHSRLATALMPLLLVLLTFPFSIRPARQGGAAKDFAVSLALTVLYWMINNSSLSLGRGGHIAPWIAAWFGCLLFFTLALLFLWKKGLLFNQSNS